MERGVVVGGLMICGSFLLAVSLNRSAVEETQPLEPPVVEAPVPSTLPVMGVEAAEAEPCAAGTNGDKPPVASDEQKQGDLPGNGRKACSQ